MMFTKFSKKHVHILDSILTAHYSLFNDEKPFSFKSLNPLSVFVHEKTVIVKIDINLPSEYRKSLIEEFNLSKFYGKAECAEGDIFDLQTGVKIARTKLMKSLMHHIRKEMIQRLHNLKRICVNFDKFFQEKIEESDCYLNELRKIDK